ncbi:MULTISPECIES: ABC transporter [Streptomyces]|uniref:ABC transporter n=1 Tax=Streptomyces lycii TaxID=2654337 RepID=A0ABQ7FQS9_9ACTN|nr:MULTISPECIES: ABC transporter [Streptomyces]KAF4411018.1 ABC transporter [Streptomyces lycii]PGH48028.1 ABC transporter [Streptomyces sp. Ru87]
MTALLHYQCALLLRSHRWMAPLLLYGAFLVIGVQYGQPLLDSLGYAAAALLPVAAWLTRVCTTNEPDAARDCASAAAGPVRVHLASLLTALFAAVLLGVVVTVLVTAVSDPYSADHRTAVPVLPAAFAGFLAALVCSLIGTAVGALCNRPLLVSPARAIPATTLAALVVLVVSGSPAQAAVSGLVTGSQSGTVALPLLPLAAALVLAAGACAAACRVSARR